MNSQELFCPNEECVAKGQVGKGNIYIHSRKESRYQCKECGKTFSQPTGTPFYRLRSTEELFVRVVTLVSHGCPVQAIVAAFCLDERTVADWQHRAGLHCQKVHEEIVEQASLAGEVQADELLGQSSKSDSVARFINPRRDAALARWRDFKEQRQFADQKHVGESQTGSRRKRLGSALYRRFEKLCESNAPGLS